MFFRWKTFNILNRLFGFQAPFPRMKSNARLLKNELSRNWKRKIFAIFGILTTNTFRVIFMLLIFTLSRIKKAWISAYRNKRNPHLSAEFAPSAPRSLDASSPHALPSPAPTAGHASATGAPLPRPANAPTLSPLPPRLPSLAEGTLCSVGPRRVVGAEKGRVEKVNCFIVATVLSKHHIRTVLLIGLNTSLYFPFCLSLSRSLALLSSLSPINPIF